MNKIFFFLVVLAVLAFGGYALYRAVVPDLIAGVTVSESLSNYIPKRLKARVEAIKNPINKGTEAMIEQMHASEIPLEKVLHTVDNITEDQAYAFLDEVTKTQPATTDEVFDIAKKHFPADFNPEVFREPFNAHFKIRQIRNAVEYANENRKFNDVELTTAKAILKNILIEKEKEIGERHSGSDQKGRTP